MAELRKYGVAATIKFPMIKRGTQDFALSTDWTPVADQGGGISDSRIDKNGAGFVNTTNLPAALTAGGGNGYWTLALTATEMQAAAIVVKIVDAATKAVEDQSIIIETYGHASAQHPFDLGALITTLAQETGGNVELIKKKTSPGAGTGL